MRMAVPPTASLWDRDIWVLQPRITSTMLWRRFQSLPRSSSVSLSHFFVECISQLLCDSACCMTVTMPVLGSCKHVAVTWLFSCHCSDTCRAACWFNWFTPRAWTCMCQHDVFDLLLNNYTFMKQQPGFTTHVVKDFCWFICWLCRGCSVRRDWLPRGYFNGCGEGQVSLSALGWCA